MTCNRIGLTLYYSIYPITIRKGTTSSQIRNEDEFWRYWISIH